MSAQEQALNPSVEGQIAGNTAENSKIDRRKFNGAHLDPYKWKPGESGNPSGRPKGVIGAEAWRQLLKNRGVKLRSVVEGIIKSCEEGNPKAFAVLRDSVDGRPAQSIDINANVTMTLAERLEAARKAIKDESSE